VVKTTLFILLLINVVTSFAQSNKVYEVDFILYLNNNNLHDDIITNFKLLDMTLYKPTQKDSIYFYTGLAYYKTGLFDTAVIFFDKIEISKSLISNSNIYKFNYYIDNYSFLDAQSALSKITFINRSERDFYIRGLALLNNDLKAYCLLTKKSNRTIFKQAILEDSFKNLKKFKRKSPAISGLLSAIAPGLGRFYLKKPLHGLASFLPVSLLAYSTYESYKSQGLKNPNFYLMGTILVVFYVGNVWGSVVSAKLTNDEKIKEINENLFKNITIPIN